MLQSEMDAAKEEREALIVLQRERQERERAEAELALARESSAIKKAQLSAAKAQLAELESTVDVMPLTPERAPAGRELLETGSPSALSPSSGGTGMMYEVLKAAAVRDGPANTAQDFKVGELAPGDVVEALELGTTKDGSLRIRVDCQDAEFPVAGWVNLNTHSGTVLLRPLKDGASPSPKRRAAPPSPSTVAPVETSSPTPNVAFQEFTEVLGTTAQDLDSWNATLRERDALMALKAQRTPQAAPTAMDEEEQMALRELERERQARVRAESELALARTRSAEKKAQLAAAKARLAELQAPSAAISDASDPLQPLVELKQAASRGQEDARQQLAKLQQERDKLLEMQSKQRAQLPDPLAAPQTALLRQATAEHAAELDRIRASSKGALSPRPTATDDLEAEAQLAQYEADLYTEEAERGEEPAASPDLARTASASLIEEANRLIATSSRRLIELEHEKRVGVRPQQAASVAKVEPVAPPHQLGAPQQDVSGDGDGDSSPLMRVAKVKMPATNPAGAPPSLQTYGIELSKTLQVLAVRPGSPAAAPGATVPLGARLVEITGYPVESLDDIDQALHVLPGQLRGGGLEFVFTYTRHQAAPAPAATLPEGVPPRPAPSTRGYSPSRPAQVAAVVDDSKEEEPEEPEEQVAAIVPVTPLKQEQPAVKREPVSATRDPVALHRPRAQGSRRKPPARGLLAARKKQGRH